MMQSKEFDVPKETEFFKQKFFNPQATKCIGDPFRLMNKYFNYENLTIKTKDDVNLRTTLIYPKFIDEKTIFFIFCKGSGSNRGRYSPFFEKGGILDRNICCLIPDYRQYGNSEGVFSSIGSAFDLDACINYFTRRFNRKINLVGNSLGSAVILEYFKFLNHRINLQINKVVLLSSFCNVVDVARSHLAYSFLNFIPKISKLVENAVGFKSYENVYFATHYKILFIHGTEDNFVPLKHSKDLATAINAKLILMYENHSSLITTANTWDTIFDFVEK